MNDGCHFAPYDAGDRAQCLAVLETNTPDYFHEHERDDYASFLDEQGASKRGYMVCRDGDGSICGAFGLLPTDQPHIARINWILIAPHAQGRGIGRAMVQYAIERARERGARVIAVATSDKSAGFFERFGARPVSHTPDGWGPGLHRVDMELAAAER